MHNPQVPETLEGWSVLHQMFRVRWDAWKSLPSGVRGTVAGEAVALVQPLEGRAEGPSALVNLIGHKGDLMLVHFRKTFEELSAAELSWARTGLFDLLEPTASFVSIVELGLYEMTGKIHEDLAARGLKGGTEEFDRAFESEVAKQRERMLPRLFTEIPRRRQVCFYPMSKRRGEGRNWYATPFDQRAAMMREHGFIGRGYSGQVVQIISGSVGLDDWEWGVDLFADDPLVFKKLVYELRFDEATAQYGEFGPFYVGLQFRAADLARLLEGHTPAL